jgi:hypothetical protein
MPSFRVVTESALEELLKMVVVVVVLDAKGLRPVHAAGAEQKRHRSP